MKPQVRIPKMIPKDIDIHVVSSTFQPIEVKQILRVMPFIENPIIFITGNGPDLARSLAPHVKGSIEVCENDAKQLAIDENIPNVYSNTVKNTEANVFIIRESDFLGVRLASETILGRMGMINTTTGSPKRKDGYIFWTGCVEDGDGYNWMKSVRSRYNFRRFGNTRIIVLPCGYAVLM